MKARSATDFLFGHNAQWTARLFNFHSRVME
jgi:hypothetical protein